jgi:hypothetical protein
VCSDNIYGSFQHFDDYCRIFLVPEHEKGAAANFSFCDNSFLISYAAFVCVFEICDRNPADYGTIFLHSR